MPFLGTMQIVLKKQKKSKKNLLHYLERYAILKKLAGVLELADRLD